jgi:plastocyanin
VRSDQTDKFLARAQIKQGKQSNLFCEFFVFIIRLFTINYFFMKKIISEILVGLVFIGLTTGCSKSNNDNGYTNTPPPGSSGNNISVNNMSYSPSSKTVAKGTMVKWTNNDAYPHTVTSDDGTTFDSGNLNAGNSYSYTANTAGTFKYHCTIHGITMAGTLVVTP